MKAKRAGVALAVITAFSCGTCLGVSAKNAIREGNNFYRKGDFDQALKNYHQALVERPDSDIVNFNLGTAFYRKGDYAKAVEYFTKALMSADKTVEADAMYNIGNCKYKIGRLKKSTDLSAAVSLYREALDYYKRAVELDQSNRDSRFNHEFVERELKLLLDRLKRQADKQPSDKEKGGSAEKEGVSSEADSQSGEQIERAEDEKKNGASGEQSGKQGVLGVSGAAEGDYPQEGAPGELSSEQARMLLERYGREDGGQLNVNRSGHPGYHPQVLKDW